MAQKQTEQKPRLYVTISSGGKMGRKGAGGGMV